MKINFGHWIAILPLESHLGHQITLHEGGEISQKNGRFISDISPRTDISPIFWRYLRKYLPSNFSPRNIVSTPLDTRYIGDISPIYPDIFLLAFKSFTIFLVKNYFFHCFRIWMLMAFIIHQLPNCCFLCGCAEENVNHILLHCIVARALWDIIFGLLDIKWVFPETVKEALTSWRGSFVGKKRKQIWKSIPLCIFWTVWKERNRLAFRGGVVNVQRLKNSFVCNLWNWAKVYLGEEAFSLIGFLEWIAST